MKVVIATIPCAGVKPIDVLNALCGVVDMVGGTLTLEPGGGCIQVVKEYP